MRTIRAGQIQSLFAGNIRKLLEECVIDYEKLYEIRLRTGRPVFLCYGDGEKFLRTGNGMPYRVTRQDLKETLEYEGMAHASTGSPRMVIKASYATYEFIDEELWLDMLTDRNRSEHVYDSTLATRLVNTILDSYIGAFEKLLEELENMYDKDLLETL